MSKKTTHTTASTWRKKDKEVRDGMRKRAKANREKKAKMTKSMLNLQAGVSDGNE